MPFSSRNEQKRSSISTLTVENSRLYQAELPMFLRSLKQNKIIKNLNLYGVRFGEIVESRKTTKRSMPLLAQRIAPKSSKEPSLESLKLWKNSLDAEDIKILTNAIKDSSSLKTLHFLGGTGLNSQTVKLLADAISENKSIEELLLFCETIQDEGAIALASALEYNTTLKNLKLFLTGIQNPGVLALSKALGKNVTLTNLELQGNTFDKKMWKVLDARLDFNRQLERAFQGKAPFIVPPSRLTVRQKNALFRLKQSRPRIQIVKSVPIDFFEMDR